MSPPRFLVFTPVPLRARCDGWDAALQLRFIELLASGAKPGEAARALGKNRQNVYALRRRAGAESFAAAWDAAAAYGARARAARPRPAPKRPRAVLPFGPRAEAIVAMGEHEIGTAASPREARAALSRMLERLYGASAKSDNSDEKAPEPSRFRDPNFPRASGRTVAFQPPPLRPGSCLRTPTPPISTPSP